MADHHDLPPEEWSIWEKPGTLRAIWVTLIISCVAFAGAGFWLAAEHELHEKPHFEGKEGVMGALGHLADHFPAFYALVGFVSFAFIVLAGQHLRAILMRDEDYYEKTDPDAPADKSGEAH